MPKIQITDFSGGINNWIDPTLIPVDSAQVLNNSKVTAGKLEPENGRIEIDDPNLPELTNQNGKRSIVRFGNHYYYSDNETGELGSTLGYIGVDPPAEPFKINPGPPGDLLEGRYKYLGLYATKEGHRSPAFLPGREQFFQLEISTFLTVAKTLVQSDLPTWPFIPFTPIPERVGRTLIQVAYIQPGLRVNYKGKTWKLKSIAKVTLVKGAIPETGGELQAPGGTNHQWEDITGVTESVSGVAYNVVSGLYPSSQPEVDRILIFRTLANDEVFYFNREFLLSEGSSYIDTISDARLAFSEQLLITNAFPPIYTEDGRVGGKYLTEVNERFWLAVGNRLYHSLQSNPHAWVPEHSIDFDTDITALARSGDSILVFLGRGNPYVVSGNKEDNTIAKVQVASNQGCPNWRTIAYSGNFPIWQSQEGQCVLEKRPLGQDPTVRVITKKRYRFPDIGNFALAKDDKYYLFFDTEVVVNDIVEDEITTRTMTAEYGYVNELNGIIHLVERARFYDMEGGFPQQQVYRSGRLYDGRAATLKNFKILDIQATGTVYLTLWYDGEEVLAEKAIECKKLKAVSLPEKDAYDIEIGLRTSVKITSLTIQYEIVEGR